MPLRRSTCATFDGRVAELARLLVVLAEGREDLDRVGARRAVAQRDDGKPAHRLVAVVRDELVQQRADVVDIAGVVARQPLEREQRRAAHSRALVVEPAPQQLLLRAEPELADRAVRDGALSEVGRARGSLELVVPLRAELRQLALLALLRQRVGFACRVGEASKIGERARRRADVASRRAHQAREALLLEDVRRPAGDTRAPEHGGRQVGRDLA